MSYLTTQAYHNLFTPYRPVVIVSVMMCTFWTGRNAHLSRESSPFMWKEDNHMWIEERDSCQSLTSDLVKLFGAEDAVVYSDTVVSAAAQLICRVSNLPKYNMSFLVQDNLQHLDSWHRKVTLWWVGWEESSQSTAFMVEHRYNYWKPSLLHYFCLNSSDIFHMHVKCCGVCPTDSSEAYILLHTVGQKSI